MHFHLAERPVAILDVLDMNTGFIIASDLIPAYIEKDRENVVQKALRITGSLPEVLVLGPGFCFENSHLKPDIEKMARRVPFEQDHLTLLLKYREQEIVRTQLVSRRLNYDGLTGGRLICSAWRVNYNFLSIFKPGGVCRYNSWLDIVNESAAL